MAENILSHKLENGVRLVMEPVKTMDSVALSLMLHHGSMQESLAENGYTHFCEHMIFKGTNRHNWKEISRVSNRLGGMMNAYTTTEHMKVYDWVVAEDMKSSFDLMTEMILESTFPEDEFEKEKKVILEEISQYEDSPEDLCFDRFQSALLLPHPAGKPIIGEAEIIADCSQTRLFEFWKSILKPHNLLISIAGNFDPEEFLELANRKFQHLRGTITSQDQREVVIPQPRVDLIDRDLEQVQFCVGAITPDSDFRTRLVWNLYDMILGGGMGSRLFDEIREKQGLAYSISSELVFLNEFGYLSIAGSASPNHCSKALDLIQEEVRKLAKDGPTADELQISKRHFSRSHMLSMESMRYRASLNGARELYGDPQPTTPELLEMLKSIELEEITEVARIVEQYGAMATCLVGPLSTTEGLENSLPRLPRVA